MDISLERKIKKRRAFLKRISSMKSESDKEKNKEKEKSKS